MTVALPPGDERRRLRRHQPPRPIHLAGLVPPGARAQAVIATASASRLATKCKRGAASYRRATARLRAWKRLHTRHMCLDLDRSKPMPATGRVWPSPVARRWHVCLERWHIRTAASTNRERRNRGMRSGAG